jgi:Leucine-rich repeat (LRR) protein
LSGDRLQQFAKENDLMLYQNLAVLNASNCRLENVEFVTTWIATLKDLDISRNLITTMENQNEMLFFVKNLVRLDMSFNFLTSMPLLFCNLVNLHTLNLSNNNVTTMCTEMGMIEGLTDLDVSCNQLAKVPPELGQCRHLTKLKLNQNRLKELPESLGQLDSLVVLILTDNFLTKIPSSFGKMTSLRKLYLDNNELTHVPTELSGAILLRELNLNNNQLVDLPRALTKLTNMTLLDLSENLFGEEKAIVLTTIGDLKAVLDKTSASKLSSAARQARGKKKTGRDTLRVPNASRPTIDGLSSGNSSPVLSRHSSVGSNTPSPAPVNRFAFAKLFRFMSITYMKEVIVDQVALAAASINEGDVFLLDLQESIYIYIGDASDPRERAKALSVANTIARDTGVPEEQLVIIEGKGKHKWASTMDFWQALGALEEGDIKKVSKHIKPAGDSDSQFIIRVTETRMWRFGEDEGDRASIAILGDGEPLVKTLLDSSSAFVIDTIGPTVYVWCGQYASPSSRSWALLKAEELVTRSEREEVGERNVMWVVDEAEAWDFKEQFFDWMDEVWDPEKQAHLEKEREVAAEAMRLMEQERREEEQAAAAAAAAAADDSEDEADTSSQEEPEHAKDEQVAEYVKAMATPVIARVTTPRLDEIKHARVPSNPIPVVPATDPTAEAMAKLAKRMPKMNASPAMPADLGKRVQFFEVAERVHTKVLREGALARARQEPSKGRARPQLQHTLSGFIEVPEAVRETALLTGPRRAAAPSRRKATKNPLKARAEMEEAAAAEAASNQPDAAATAAAAAEKEARLRAAGGGGMGFGKGVLAEAESLFQKKRIAAESGESVNTIGEDAIAKKGQPRLLHIKGRRKLIVKQVEVAASSLNDGDVFALDTGRGVLYQWNGAKANRIEKGKAMDVLKNIKDKEMNGQAKVIVLEQGQESDQANGFWNLLGGKPASIASGDSAGDDENVDALLKEFTNLYKLVESTDPSAAPVSTAAARRGSARRAAPATSVHPELVAKYPLQKEMLEHEFCYLLDSVWYVFPTHV